MYMHTHTHIQLYKHPYNHTSTIDQLYTCINTYTFIQTVIAFIHAYSIIHIHKHSNFFFFPKIDILTFIHSYILQTTHTYSIIYTFIRIHIIIRHYCTHIHTEIVFICVLLKYATALWWFSINHKPSTTLWEFTKITHTWLSYECSTMITS